MPWSWTKQWDVAAAMVQQREAQDGYREWLPRLASWDFYATLTYDPSRSKDPGAPPSHEAAKRHLAGYLTDLSELRSAAVLGAFALEHTKNGQPHWHGLLALGGVLALRERDLYRPWFDRRGYAKVSAIRPGTEAQVAAYVAKYLVKESGELIIDWRPRGLIYSAVQKQLQSDRLAGGWYQTTLAGGGPSGDR